MTSALLLALLATAPSAGVPATRVYLKAAAAAVPDCAARRVDDRVVSADLFSPGCERCPVAFIGEEPIALGELAGAVEFKHVAGVPQARGGKAPRLDLGPPLDRLINSRLIIQEAREMQLDQDPEVRKDLEGFRAERLRKLVQDSASRQARPDPAEVERLYREAVREWKLKSVLFEKEEAARAFQAELAAGQGFDALAARYVKEGTAKGGGPSEFAPRKQMLPEVLEAVRAAKQGALVGPVKVPAGLVMLRVDGVRHPADPKARQEARQQALDRAEFEAVRKLYEGLIARHARVDRPLLESLDLEKDGEKGFQALLADQRTLAGIEGEAPVTVGDLTLAVSVRFFHGLNGPIEQHKVNPEKQPAFEKLLGARLFAREAGARKLEQDPGFLRDVAAFERMQAFNTFVERVIVPDVKVTEPDAQAWYEAHRAELSSPEMFKLDGIAFATARQAQAALDKLKAGTDFAWLRTNAPDQLEPAHRTLQLDGQTLSATGLPASLARAVAGAGAGDYRLFSASGAEFYVIKVVAHAPPMPQPYLEAREKIVKQLFAERVTQGIADYAGKLRGAQKVEVLITRASP